MKIYLKSMCSKDKVIEAKILYKQQVWCIKRKGGESYYSKSINYWRKDSLFPNSVYVEDELTNKKVIIPRESIIEIEKLKIIVVDFKCKCCSGDGVNAYRAYYVVPINYEFEFDDEIGERPIDFKYINWDKED